MTINKEQFLCQQLILEAIVRLVKKANEFEGNVLVKIHQNVKCKKYIMSMFDGTSCTMTFLASGKDSKKAVKALKKIFTKC